MSMIGESISHYKIISKLGEGGMGEVFLAEDTKLDRKVALKFLPAHLSVQDDVKARFIQEAKAASALSHPNVCTIYDILEAEGRIFIAMQHVDGRTLRDMRGTLSEKQTLEIAAQVADGLAAAHEKGIVHRDIKSENIMLRKDGIPQIMDFGLAKLRGVSRLTKEGSTLGTVGYMSPEQALGQDVDHRSDLFSLGVVLYELLTGELPFKGGHEAAIMYEIVNVDAAPPSAVKPDTDPELDRIVLECLQKEPSERYQSAREVAKDLRRFKRDSGRKSVSRVSTVRASQAQFAPRLNTTPHETVEAQAISLRKRSTSAWVVAAVAVLLAIASVIWKFADVTPESEVIRASLIPPAATSYYSSNGGHISMSPDGRYLAFVGVDSVSGNQNLIVRALNSSSSLPLPGTEGAYYPFWSADSRYLGFFADKKLKKIRATGGPAQTICEAPAGRGGTWNADGVIVFAPDQSRTLLHRVSATGGMPMPVTEFDSTQSDFTHRWPWFLPDGNHFLFFARTGGGGGSEKDAICLGSLEGGIAQRLIPTKSDVAFASGHILYMLNGTLMAHPFNPSSRELTGDAVPLVENVSMNQGFSRGVFAVSQSGLLIFQQGEVLSGSQLTMFDREGRVIDTIGNKNTMYTMQFSPDEMRLAVDILEPVGGNTDIWIHDLTRRLRTRFTFDSVMSIGTNWSPDGSRIAFTSIEEAATPGKDPMWGIYVKDASGARPAELLVNIPMNAFAQDWSRDGRYISCRLPDSTGRPDIGIFEIGRDSVVNRFTATAFRENGAKFSGSVRWLAYESDESGEGEVYVVPFPDPTGKWQVSNSGGSHIKWGADDKILYYVDNSDRIMEVEVDGSGESFKIGEVRPLFVARGVRLGSFFTPSRDGQRFLVNLREGKQSMATLSLVINWPEELKPR